MTQVQRKEWESRAALLTDTTSIPTVIVGTEAEAPRKFYSMHIESERKSWRVAVISSGLGTEPDLALMLKGRRAVVGHDAWLTWIDVERVAAIASHRLGGVFFEFFATNREDEVIAVHEVGALKVNSDGRAVWSVDTDVVEDCRVEDGNLILSVMDQSANTGVSLDSGRVFEIRAT